MYYVGGQDMTIKEKVDTAINGLNQYNQICKDLGVPMGISYNPICFLSEDELVQYAEELGQVVTSEEFMEGNSETYSEQLSFWYRDSMFYYLVPRNRGDAK